MTPTLKIPTRLEDIPRHLPTLEALLDQAPNDSPMLAPLLAAAMSLRSQADALTERLANLAQHDPERPAVAAELAQLTLPDASTVDATAVPYGQRVLTRQGWVESAAPVPASPKYGVGVRT